MFAEVSSLFVVNVVNAINVNVVNVDSFCQVHPLKTGGFMWLCFSTAETRQNSNEVYY